MTNGSTHDSKRGEDVRARIGVLSQLGSAWREHVEALRRSTDEYRPADLDGRTENLLWQTLAGTWTSDGPIAVDRLTGYLIKAAREAKDWTTWTGPDHARESELIWFTETAVADRQVAELMAAWVRRTAEPVRTAVLVTKALQLTLPGVADVYQGTETTAIGLVDPDNRGPVDVAPLARALARLDAGQRPDDLGEEKLRLVAALLRLRRSLPEVFVGKRGGYAALPTTTGHALAFMRTLDGEPRVCTVVTRLPVALAASGGWSSNSVVLPQGRWRDVVTHAEHAGGSVALTELLTETSVAVLASV